MYAPCALGGALDDDTVPVAARPRSSPAAANNQLAHPGIEKLLAERGILYAPDYVVNAGGVIQVADEIEGFNFERAKLRATRIYDTTRQILQLADAEGVPPAVAADRLAERRMAEVGRLRAILRTTRDRHGVTTMRRAVPAALPDRSGRVRDAPMATQPEVPKRGLGHVP